MKIEKYFLSYLQTMEDWAADWDMESWEDVTVTPTEYWVRSILYFVSFAVFVVDWFLVVLGCYSKAIMGEKNA